MDGIKTVTKALTASVFPFLKNKGFRSVSSRTAWRYSSKRIDVFNIQSFDKRLAESIGCTTHSFSVNLACFLTYIPGLFPIKVKEGLLRPHEYECHFRGRLHRGFHQDELSRRDIWYVDPECENVENCTKDVIHQLNVKGLSWFDKFSVSSEVSRILLEDGQNMDECWGFGNDPSPIRSFMLGYTSLEMGNDKLADTKLQEAVLSGCFRHIFSNVKDARDKVKVG